jgi:hypothetical protein
LTDLNKLIVDDPSSEIVTWQGRRALKLNGLAVIPDLSLAEGHIEVGIGADGAAYPGIAFRIKDVLNFELAYAQPHTSGKWDAIQYDPVFHGSNTWQLYNGVEFQKLVRVPLGEWFTFQIDFANQSAKIRVEEQEALIVHRLAHTHREGLIGIWTYLPAYFCNFQVLDQESNVAVDSFCEMPGSSSHMVMEWFAEGFGKLECEPNGILNLNRFFSASIGEVTLFRWVEAVAKEKVEMNFGFSDKLSLWMDDDNIFNGENLYKSSPDREDRGYVEKQERIDYWLNPGLHKLTAKVSTTEWFGWGLVFDLIGNQIQILPAYTG